MFVTKAFLATCINGLKRVITQVARTCEEALSELFTSDGVIKRNALPEGYPYKEIKEIVLYENNEFAAVYNEDGVNQIVVIADAIGLEEGKDYTVEYDGGVYECVATAFKHGIGLGNPKLYNFSGLSAVDNGLPFGVWDGRGYSSTHEYGLYAKFPKDDKDNHTIKITCISEVVKTIDEDLLPDSVKDKGVTSWNDLTDKPFDETNIIKREALPEGYPYKEVTEERVVFSDKRIFNYTEENIDHAPGLILEAGKDYIVEFDGERYELTAYTGAYDDEDPVVLGRSDGATVPYPYGFLINDYDGFISLYVNTEGGEHSFRILTTDTIVHQLKGEYVEGVPYVSHSPNWIHTHFNERNQRAYIQDRYTLLADGALNTMVTVSDKFIKTRAPLPLDSVESIIFWSGDYQIVVKDVYQTKLNNGSINSDYADLDGVVITYADNVTVNGHAFPEAGTYVDTTYDSYSTLMYAEKVVQPLDEDFLPGTVPTKDEVILVPETASVGQTLVVKSVDENGKPTEWEASSFPENGVTRWEDLTDRPFGEESVSLVIAEEAPITNRRNIQSTVPGYSIRVGTYVLNGEKIVEGETYIVTLDGVEYTGVAQRSDDVNSGRPYIFGAGDNFDTVPINLLVITGTAGKYIVNARLPDTDQHTVQVTWVRKYEAISLDVLPGNVPVINEASVGQTVIVKAVDENGTPTKWMAVDLPTGDDSGGAEDAVAVLAESGIIELVHQDGVVYTDTDGNIFTM